MPLILMICTGARATWLQVALGNLRHKGNRRLCLFLGARDDAGWEILTSHSAVPKPPLRLLCEDVAGEKDNLEGVTFQRLPASGLCPA